MKRVAVVTATRAEYGLLSGLIRALRTYENENFRTELIVTGTHLSEQYGRTIQEIEMDGLRIDDRIVIPVASDDEVDISRNQAETLVKFTELFARERFDAVVLLGDRYETLAIAIAAGNTRTPIMHLCGGDTTEGAIDEWIRHSLTKISYLHFPTNEQSKDRIIQMGEAPERVFNYGSTSIDNILSLAAMTKEEALQSVGLENCQYSVCTYHPVTMETGGIAKQMESFLLAIKAFPQIEFIVTKSNADQGGAEINAILDAATDEIHNLHVFNSLGVKRYLSLMKHAEFVLGNSSSGIIETPAFHIPTVNIGDRQKGRLQVESIINCGSNASSIIKAINYALNDEMKEKCCSTVSPYGNGTAAVNIAKKIYEILQGDSIDLKKRFYSMKACARWVECEAWQSYRQEAGPKG